MLEASCLCGGIRVQVQGRHSGVAHCHCSRCRKVSGVGSYAHVIVPFGRLVWRGGEQLVTLFEMPSGFGTAFCRVCGSPAPDTDRGKTLYRIPVGMFDNDPAFTVIEHIFAGSKASWDVIGDDGTQFEGDGPPREDFEAFDARKTSRGPNNTAR